MIKPLKGLLLALLLVVCGAAKAESTVAVGGLYYNVNADENTVTLTKSPGERYAGDIVVPSEIVLDGKKYTVGSIDKMCFGMCSDITSVTIPSSVKSLGECCFYGCTKLASVSLPSTISKIAKCCFSDCASLKTITIPSSVTTLDDQCFWNCTSLAAVNIPSSVTAIKGECFWGCSSLKTITIPASVGVMGEACFLYCKSLASIEVSEDNMSFASRDGVLYDKAFTQVVRCPEAKAGRFVVPSSVTALSYDAFGNCSSLTDITMPSSLTTVGTRSFTNCTALVDIVMPEKVAVVGDECFIGCSNLKNVTFLYAINDADKNKLSSDYADRIAFNGAETTGLMPVISEFAASCDGEVISVSGLNAGETVEFYNAKGMSLGTAKAVGSAVKYPLSSSDSFIIAKVGKKSVKVVTI